MNNSIQPNELIAKLDGLAADRMAWENGTLKASNNELYVLLNKCVVLYREISPSVTLKVQLTQELKARNIPFNKGAKLHTRIVRWVFGETAQQHVYSKVIKIAAEELSESESFSDWLENSGGLSLVASRDNKGRDKRERAQQQTSVGSTHLLKAPALASLPSTIACLKADADSNQHFAVALIRRSANGNFDLVFGSNNERLVEAMLQLAGRIAQPEIEANAAVQAARKQAHDIKAAIDETLGEVRL